MQGREIAARVRAPRPAGLPPSWTPLHTHTHRHHPRCRTRMPVRQWSVCLPQSRRYPSTSDLPVESPSPTRRSLCDSGPTVSLHAAVPSSSATARMPARGTRLAGRGGGAGWTSRRGVTAKGRSETPRPSGSPFVRVASRLAPPPGALSCGGACRGRPGSWPNLKGSLFAGPVQKSLCHTTPFLVKSGWTLVKSGSPKVFLPQLFGRVQPARPGRSRRRPPSCPSTS